MNQQGPGTADRVLTPVEACDRVESVAGLGPLRVVGIAGPGEPLANPETFSTLQAVSAKYPHLLLCLSTNGLLLSDSLAELLRCRMRSVTVTINAVTEAVAGRLYAWARIGEQHLAGKEAAAAVLSRQWNGLRDAVHAGLLVKVNSILIPDVNDSELPEIARLAAEAGVHRHNITPLIPRNRFRHLQPPSAGEVDAARQACGRWLQQFTGCMQCRADACFMPNDT